MNFVSGSEHTTESKEKILKVYIGCAFATGLVINLPKFLEVYFMGNDQFVTFFVYFNFLAIPILLQGIPNIIILFYGFKTIKAMRNTPGESQGGIYLYDVIHTECKSISTEVYGIIPMTS